MLSHSHGFSRVGVARGEDASGSATPLAMRPQRHAPRSSRTNHYEPHGDFARTRFPLPRSAQRFWPRGPRGQTGTIAAAKRPKRICVGVPQDQTNACRGAARPLEASVCAARLEYTGRVGHRATSAFGFRGGTRPERRDQVTPERRDQVAPERRDQVAPERRDQVARMAGCGESADTIPNPVDHGRYLRLDRGFESGRLAAQELAEVRDGERDQAPFRAVDQALLNQAVPGRGEA